MRRSTVRAVLGVAAPLALVACAQPPMTASSDYIAPPVLPGSGQPSLQGCKLAITAISDARLDPTTIGNFGRPIRGPADAPAWLASVLKSLSRYGVDVSFPSPGAAPQDGLTASVTLVTLWVAPIITAKTGSVVIGVRYARGGAAVKQANYRGRESDLDWSAGSDEIQSMIDDTAAQAVQSMADDLATLCAPPARVQAVRERSADSGATAGRARQGSGFQDLARRAARAVRPLAPRSCEAPQFATDAEVEAAFRRFER